MREQLQEPESLSQADVLGLPVHISQDYIGWLNEQRRHSQGVHVVTLNAEMAMQAEQNSELAAVIRRAELVIPDGAGIVFYLWLRRQRIQRCPGIELAEALMRRSPQGDVPNSVFFYGGAPGVAQAAADAWQQKLPELAIAGTQHGYLSATEQQELCKTLSHLRPTLIFVG